MEKIITIAQVIAPIFAAVCLGMISRKKGVITPEGNRGLQQFVMNYGLPCVMFNSCLSADIGAESISTMVMVFPLLLISSIWAFRARKKYAYHNFPMLFAAQESGMLGIPLFMILFGAEQAYRMGVIDMTQTLTAVPVIAILSADAGENPTPAAIGKKVVTSPLLIVCVLGLALNLSGAIDWMNAVGIGGILTESTSFLAQPVSAVILFTVGYNFSLSRQNRKPIFRIAGLHFLMFAVFCLIMQAGLLLIPNVDPVTRWAVLLYGFLPSSFIAPGLGRSEEDSVVASGVCSVLTAASLIVFCAIAVMVA